MNFLPENISSVFFIGICGISMSSLAFITNDNGIKVGGSDTNDGAMAEKLRMAGIEIFIGHSADNLKGYDAVVYTAAISPDNPEMVYAREKGLHWCSPFGKTLFRSRCFQLRIDTS